MLEAIYKILQKILPSFFFEKIKSFYFWFYQKFYLPLLIKQAEKNHKKALKKLKNKKKIKVAFLFLIVSNWKYHSLYQAFIKSGYFDPIVIITPFITEGKLFLKDELQKSIDFCKKNEYFFFNAYNELTGKGIDFKKLFLPDIVFFSNPHKHTYKEFLIENFKDTLTCYIPYSVRSDHLINLAFNKPFQQLIWLNFYESDLHKEIAYEFAYNKGKNVEVVGYPTYDDIIKKKLKYDKVSQKKRIIWAPHWTIIENDTLNRSCFLKYCNFFTAFGLKYFNTIDLVFRPHPLLKSTLYKDNIWGKEKTDAYFNIWMQQSNLSISDGDYIDLFVNSDLMIHDSVSFLTEYLVTGNPIIFTQTDKNIDPPFNKFGLKCLEAHYIVKNENDLMEKMNDILFNNIDEKFYERQVFLKNYIYPYTDTVSKIENSLIKKIKNVV